MAEKYALVTGAGKGIGKGIAESLIQNGYHVAAHYYQSGAGVEELRQLGQKHGVCVIGIQADLSTYQGVELVFAQLKASFPRLDLMVYNSGVTICRPFLKLTPEDFQLVTDLDWQGGFFCTQFAARMMIDAQTRGHIVLITSNQAHMVYPDGSMYGSVKAALSHFTKCAAIELAAHGIRVNAVSPGYTDTGDPRMGEKESTYEVIPMRRWCTPEEIARLILHLDSEWAQSITGAEMMIDGGGSLTCKDTRAHD